MRYNYFMIYALNIHRNTCFAWNYGPKYSNMYYVFPIFVCYTEGTQQAIKWVKGSSWAKENSMSKHWDNLWNISDLEESWRMRGSRTLQGKWKKAYSSKHRTVSLCRMPSKSQPYCYCSDVSGPWTGAALITETQHTLRTVISYQSHCFLWLIDPPPSSSKQLQLGGGQPHEKPCALPFIHLRPLYYLKGWMTESGHYN